MGQVIMGSAYSSFLEQGGNPRSFKYRFLAEGDSWMDRSGVLTWSLPDSLAPAFQAQGDNVLIINIAKAGDQLRRIGDTAQGDFRVWLADPSLPWKFDAVLLSAGGNDFIDAASDPPAGQGILVDCSRLKTAPTRVQDCIRSEAMTLLTEAYLNPHFLKIYNTLQGSQHRGIPLFLNQYDVPAARNAPIPLPRMGPWLFAAYQKNQIPVSLWDAITHEIFEALQRCIQSWATGRSNVYLVPTRGVLTPASTSAVANDHDWLNEIHPNRQGWKKLAAVWLSCIHAVLTKSPD